MLEILLCTFVAPSIVGAHVLPGACGLTQVVGELFLLHCNAQTMTYVIALNQTFKEVERAYPCNLDWVGYYNGTLFIHPRCKNFIESSDGTRFKLPSRDVCKIELKNGTLLAVGKNWFVVFDVEGYTLLKGRGFGCPATLSPDGRYVVLRDLKGGRMVIMDVKHGGLIVKTIPFRCWKDADWGKGGLALTRPGKTWFNGKEYPYGGNKVSVGDKPYLIDTKPYCEGVMTIVDGRDYCMDLGFVPSSVKAMNSTVAVTRGGVVLIINVEESLKHPLGPLAPT